MDLPERIPLNDARLAHITRANTTFENLPEQLEQAWSELAPLIEYYETGWSGDMQNYPGAQFGVLSEDGVWNEMGRFYHALKEIAAVSARIVREYENGGESGGES
nr:Uncharacterised protein [Streptococcus thermophilus]